MPKTYIGWLKDKTLRSGRKSTSAKNNALSSTLPSSPTAVESSRPKHDAETNVLGSKPSFDDEAPQDAYAVSIRTRPPPYYDKEGSLEGTGMLRGRLWSEAFITFNDRSPELADTYKALHVAAMSPYDSLNIIRLLLEHGADGNARDMRGRMPLHLAARSNCMPNLRAPVEHEEHDGDEIVDMHARDMYGNEVMHFVTNSAAQQTDVLQYLVDHGANINTLNGSLCWNLTKGPALYLDPKVAELK
ncbi:hypothetical protein Sste5346_004836 [Sporothrix stenoceras]|uniref:Ankyrin repeat protein n=1 Tax=Sporothrix stenoceras TaxID=5173 RepID=A0ABR3Z7P1_9PEZI